MLGAAGVCRRAEHGRLQENVFDRERVQTSQSRPQLPALQCVKLENAEELLELLLEEGSGGSCSGATPALAVRFSAWGWPGWVKATTARRSAEASRSPMTSNNAS